MGVSYRLNTEADEPALVDLWTRHSDWGNITAEEWEHKFVRTPDGPAVFVLAIDDDSQEIVAQLAYILHPILLAGKPVRGVRPFAVIVNEKFRSKTGILKLQQMIVRMYNMAAEIMASQGVELLFMVPDPRWARIIKMWPFFHSTTFPLWSRPLPLAEPRALAEGYSVEPIAPDDPRINALSEKAGSLYQCMVARDARMLPWKLSHEPYRVHGVCFQNRLVGLFAFLNRRKDNQWLLTDVLSENADEALQATLQAACLVVDASNSQLPDEERAAYRKIAVLATPIMEPPLQRLGFARDKYDFLLVVHPLNKQLTKVQVAPEKWYVSAND